MFRCLELHLSISEDLSEFRHDESSLLVFQKKGIVQLFVGVGDTLPGLTTTTEFATFAVAVGSSSSNGRSRRSSFGVKLSASAPLPLPLPLIPLAPANRMVLSK